MTFFHTYYLIIKQNFIKWFPKSHIFIEDKSEKLQSSYFEILKILINK